MMKKGFLWIGLSICLLSVGCSSGSTPSDNDHIKISGDWKSGAVALNGLVVNYLWSFEKNEFLRTIEYVNGSPSVIEGGVYTVGRSRMMPSGLTAFEINLTYVNPDDTTTTKLDIVYINNNSLYFGQENVIDPCEGEYFTETRVNEIVVNNVVVDTQEETVCLSRPTSLDLDLPHDLFIPES